MILMTTMASSGLSLPGIMPNVIGVGVGLITIWIIITNSRVLTK